MMEEEVEITVSIHLKGVRRGVLEVGPKVRHGDEHKLPPGDHGDGGRLTADFSTSEWNEDVHPVVVVQRGRKGYGALK